MNRTNRSSLLLRARTTPTEWQGEVSYGEIVQGYRPQEVTHLRCPFLVK